MGIAGIAWSAYFDDYSTITRPELEASTRWALTTLFELTGLLYAKEGPKAPPCNAVFKMLGLVVDLQGIPSKPFFVTHTAERRAELKQCLEEITNKGEILSKEAERIRGRMLFFECFVCGRVANLDLKLFRNLCRAGSHDQRLDHWRNRDCETVVQTCRHRDCNPTWNQKFGDLVNFH